MTKECKKARNAVLIPLVIILGLIMFCSSCASTYTTCPAYGSAEQNEEEFYGSLNCENCDEVN